MRRRLNQLLISANCQPALVSVAHAALHFRADHRSLPAESRVVTGAAQHNPRARGRFESAIESEPRLDQQGERAASVVASDRLADVEDQASFALKSACKDLVR